MTYADVLRVHDHITESDVEEAIDLIPEEVRQKLASGPLPHRYDCGVCQAFGAKSNSVVDYEAFDVPSFIVWIYHELPKVEFKVSDQNFYGEGANEIYRRCLTTYRIAGWNGDEEEPNA